jgi:hypothetical protein
MHIISGYFFDLIHDLFPARPGRWLVALDGIRA